MTSFEQIEYYCASTNSIRHHTIEVENLLLMLTNDERLQASSIIKSKVQREAQQAWEANNRWGCLYMATGTGKSKVAINISKIVERLLKFKILLVVPTEKLRDENWKEEFTKWDSLNTYNRIERCCYASLNKYENYNFDLVILDEGHNITPNNSQFFAQNRVKSCILLTATKPDDSIKLQILRGLHLNPVYELTLDDSVRLGLVAPYDITIITTTLSTGEKYIKAGNKQKTFYQNEKERYNYLTKRCIATPSKTFFLSRMRFIYNLKSKTEATKAILENVIPKDLRTLIFCGSIDQAENLCPYTFHSKTTDKYLTMFKKKEINRTACVNALNEGQNIDELDVAFIVQLNSKELHLIQRIGRFIRYRVGHIGKIIILCVEDTVDKDWVNKAIANLNPVNIKWIELSRLRMGIETINF